MASSPSPTGRPGRPCSGGRSPSSVLEQTGPSTMIDRRRVVAVLGSGDPREEHDQLARPLGTWLAGAGYHLLTGGGRGVMTAVARAFTGVEGRAGLSIGIIPGSVDDE